MVQCVFLSLDSWLFARVSTVSLATVQLIAETARAAVGTCRPFNYRQRLTGAENNLAGCRMSLRPYDTSIRTDRRRVDRPDRQLSALDGRACQQLQAVPSGRGPNARGQPSWWCGR